MKRSVAVAACVLFVSRALAGEVTMIHLGGTPAEIGRTWGEINKKAIAHDIDANYLKKAAAAGISKDTLIERSQAFVRIAKKVAPHWLEEAKAIARAAGIDETLYVSFIGGRTRNRFLHECTSYSVSHEHTCGNAILFHKTRDNVKKAQAAYILDGSAQGLNKFIAICDASNINCSMMVNEKGLAGCCDYPATLTRKNDPSALVPEPAEPQYRGMMGGHFLRYIAERSSSCGEALETIRDFVKKGYYAGGTVNGQHWLFVDREGVILEVSSNSRHVVSKVHTQKVYFSRLDDSAAAKRLREKTDPIDFQLFHSVSRDPSICLGSSIAGMTVEIDPTYPELFTCAWVTLPARGVSFPLLMGQTRTPDCLLNGEAYSLGTKIEDKTRLWELIEQSAHLSKELLKHKIAAGRSANKPQREAQVLQQWSHQQAEMLVELLRTML
jgi:hypothetical protein